MCKPTIGADVHYVIERGRALGEHCAAKVTRVIDHHRVNLRLFPDGTNHGIAVGSKEEWRECVPYSDAGHAGSWHFPEE